MNMQDTIIASLVEAMRNSMECGATKALDPHEHDGAFWHGPLETAEAYLRSLRSPSIESGGTVAKAPAAINKPAARD